MDVNEGKNVSKTNSSTSADVATKDAVVPPAETVAPTPPADAAVQPDQATEVIDNEYHEIAEGVKGRVSTDEEKAARAAAVAD